MNTNSQKMTLDEISYQNMKLQFIAELRDNLKKTVEDFVTTPKVDERNFDPAQHISDMDFLSMQLYRFFDPFVSFLDRHYDCGFFLTEETATPQNFSLMCQRFIDLAKFILLVFEPSAKVFEEKILHREDYTGLIDEFDRQIMRDFLH